MTKKIMVGISSCLLGNKVRYDGGHKRDLFIVNTLGQWLDFVPVCPEVECGLPIPREALRLVGDDPIQARLITRDTGHDFTEQMQSWGKEKLQELRDKNLCGYIFKSKSPSSGMERIKVYNSKGFPVNKGVGIWARMFMEYFPLLPVEDEGRLHDAKLRENFIQSIFVYKAWQDMLAKGESLGNLVDFHTRHKLQIMAHKVEIYRELGKLVGDGKQMPIQDLLKYYEGLLSKAIKQLTSLKTNRNVLQHIMGYFKNNISADEKQELLEVIDHYAQGDIPLIVPLTLLNHYVRKYKESYLELQTYLHPHPIELKLLNHV